MRSAPIAHSQNRDSTPPVPARLVALRFALDCHHAKKEATRPGSLDDAKGSKNDRARQKYTR
jgi:hypothetical protein